MLRDRALITSFESRVPLIQNAFGFDYIELAHFVDFGRGWNTKRETLGPQDLSSVGVGLRWALAPFGRVPFRPQFEIYWGHRLRNIPQPKEKKLQDHGIHLQFVLAMF
jgi:hemolysin activation/secretion protein